MRGRHLSVRARRRHPRPTGSILAGVLLLAACGDGAPSEDLDAAATTVAPTTTDAADTEPADTAAPPGDAPAMPGPRSLELRPVLSAVAPCPGSPAPEAGATVPSDTTTPPGSTTPARDTAQTETTVPGPAGDAATTVIPSVEGPCVEVGPVGLDDAALASAEPQAAAGAWVVEVVVGPEHRAAANEMFNQCYRAAPTCPANGAEGRGLLAIVLDGQVISSPQVNDLDLADDPFNISGGGQDGFTEAEARGLAASLVP